MQSENEPAFSSRQHPIIGVAILAGVLREIDVDPEPLLIRAGIEPARIHDPGAHVTATQELALIRHAIAATDVPDLGLSAGRRHHFSLFGMWGFAMASSPTLNEAVRLGLRYIDLTHTFLRWSYVAERDNPRLELVEAYRLGTARRFVIERDMSACITLVQDMTGNRQALRQARFPYPRPEVCDSYEAIFGANIEFDASRATLLIDPTQLSVPLPQASLVYFPSCMTRVFGSSAEGVGPGLAESLVSVASRAGVAVHVPDGVRGLCCGMPFSSKRRGSRISRVMRDWTTTIWLNRRTSSTIIWHIPIVTTGSVKVAVRRYTCECSLRGISSDICRPVRDELIRD